MHVGKEAKPVLDKINTVRLNFVGACLQNGMDYYNECENCRKCRRSSSREGTVGQVRCSLKQHFVDIEVGQFCIYHTSKCFLGNSEIINNILPFVDYFGELNVSCISDLAKKGEFLLTFVRFLEVVHKPSVSISEEEQQDLANSIVSTNLESCNLPFVSVREVV